MIPITLNQFAKIQPCPRLHIFWIRNSVWENITWSHFIKLVEHAQIGVFGFSRLREKLAPRRKVRAYAKVGYGSVGA
jgi:hypothetical protein